MSEYRVASRYVKSLIQLADETKSLEAVSADMELLAQVCSNSRDLSLLLSSPIVKQDKKHNVLKAIFEGKVTELTLTFFDIILRKRRERFLPLIANEFHNQYNELKGVQESTVTTTFPLTDDLRKEFLRITKEVTGKTPELTEQVDEKLLGGFVLKIGDRQIDDSLKSKLNELHLTLKDTTYEKKI